MFTKPIEKVESYPAQLRKLSVGESAHFERSYRSSIQKAVQRLGDECLSFRINTNEDTIKVTRTLYVANSAVDEVINGLKVGERFTRPLSKELESRAIIQQIKGKKYNIIKDIEKKQLTIVRIK